MNTDTESFLRLREVELGGACPTRQPILQENFVIV